MSLNQNQECLQCVQKRKKIYSYQYYKMHFYFYNPTSCWSINDVIEEKNSWKNYPKLKVQQ